MENLSNGQALQPDNSRRVGLPMLENPNSVTPFSGSLSCQHSQASLYQGYNLDPSQFVHPEYGSLQRYPQSSLLSGIQGYPNLHFTASDRTSLSSFNIGTHTTQTNPLMLITTNKAGKESNMSARHQTLPSFSSVCDFAVSNTPSLPMTGIFHDPRRCFPSQCDFIGGNTTPVNALTTILPVEKSGFPSISKPTCSHRLPDLASPAMNSRVFKNYSNTDMTGENCCGYPSEHVMVSWICESSNISSSSAAQANVTISENSGMKNSKILQNKNLEMSTIQSYDVQSGLMLKTLPYDNPPGLFHHAMTHGAGVSSAQANSNGQDNPLGTMGSRACSPTCRASCSTSDDMLQVQETLQSVKRNPNNHQHFQSFPSFTDSEPDSNSISPRLHQGMISPDLNVAQEKPLNFFLGRQESKSTEVKQDGLNQGEIGSIRRHSLWHQNMTSGKPVTDADTRRENCVYESPNEGQEFDESIGGSYNADTPVQTRTAECPGDEFWRDAGDPSVECSLVGDMVEHVSTEDTMASTDSTLPLITSSDNASIPSVPESSGGKAENETGTLLEELCGNGVEKNSTSAEKFMNENMQVTSDARVVNAESSEPIPQEAESTTKGLVKKSVNKVKRDVQIVIDNSQFVMEGDSRRWQCTLCEKSYTTKNNLVIHMLDHQGVKPHKCLTCGQSFRQLGHLNTHILTHDNIKPHTCETCGKSFTQASHLKRHQIVHGRTSNVCDRCQRTFTYPSDLQAHKKRYGKKPCLPQCSHRISAVQAPALPDQHRSGQDVRREVQSCRQCDQVFKSTNDLRRHMLSHGSERPYECSDCGLKFSKDRYLRAHQLTHSGVKPFKCDVCGRGFHQKANMERHQLIHNSSRAFECEVCRKSFTQLQILKAHQVTHSNRKPFRCQLCGREFSRLYNLRGHMHVHDNSKPYSCFCGNSFTLRGNLTRHKKVKHGLDETTENMEEEAVQLLKSFSERAREEQNPISNNLNDLTNVSEDKDKKAEACLNNGDSSKISVSLLETENGSQISNGRLNSRCFTKGVLGLREISPSNKMEWSMCGKTDRRLSNNVNVILHIQTDRRKARSGERNRLEGNFIRTESNGSSTLSQSSQLGSEKNKLNDQ
ncbi:uncharacterized protein LOC135472497 [Liolophura sinensis]|uniref:uncharacterized protein LOC135472497 n=1 Tax=Liolophura sinensis TaxID=3198878 RepID=UPI0031585A9D